MEKRTRSTRKVLSGCAIAAGIAVALLLALASGAYFAIRRVTGPMPYLGAAAALDRKAMGSLEFRPPASGELSEEQVKAFLAIEREVESRLGENLAELRARSEDLIRESRKGTAALPVRPTLSALNPIGRTFLQAKTTQFDALNRAAVSREEFEWTRQQLYHAAALEAWQLDFADFLRGVPGAEFTVHRLPHGTDAPSANRSFAELHIVDLRRWAPLAFFGL